MDRSHLAVRINEVVAEHGARPALRVRRGEGWKVWTFAEMGTLVRRIAAQLVELGIQTGDRVAIFSNNRPEWTLVDLACLTIRAVPVPIYATSSTDQVKHILANAGCTVGVLDGETEWVRVAEVRAELPDLAHVITFEQVDADGVVSLQEIMARPVSEEAKAEVEARLAVASGEDLATIIYTSGTTGTPRGVMLPHRAFTAEIDSLTSFFDVTPDDSSLAFLPLSHALERAWTFFVLCQGCQNTYVRNAKQVAEMLVLAKPSLMVSVPRLYEKVYLTAHQKVASSPAKKRIFEWALRVGGQCQRAYRKGKEPSPYWKAQLPLADKLVLSSIREAMGGPKTVMACGGAPVREEIEEFFSAAGMLLSSGYGLSEAAPLVSFNSPRGFKFGTAGRVMTGGELRIAEAGEICYRGPNVMLGYWNDPAATKAAIDAEGWLYTGDVGYVDVDGYLVITDRIKDLIVTSTGKNIAPAAIEGTILADPLFEQAVVLGNNRPFLTLLVSPSMPQVEELAKQLQIKWDSRAELFENPQIVDAIRRRVGVLTEKLAHYEQIRDLRVMLEEFTMDNGLLTPTLKVKRREVEKRFAQVIEDMYARVAERRKGGSHEG